MSVQRSSTRYAPPLSQVSRVYDISHIEHSNVFEEPTGWHSQIFATFSTGQDC